MQKIIGSVLIVLASTGIGIGTGIECQCCLKELEELRQLFLMLRSEIKYTKAPFGEAFFHIGRKLRGTFGSWMLDLAEKLEEKSGARFCTLWNESVEVCLNKSSLKRADLEQLQSLGTHMGYLDEEMQLGALDLYLEQLELRIGRMREELVTKRRLCHCMGVLGGLFLVVIFL